MSLKKLLLATTLTLPTLGYCGFIDWIKGYPEIKEKIEQQLEYQYNGEKFKVWGISYSDNLKGYNFDYKPKDSTSDYSYSGSYYLSDNSISATGYMWSSIGKQWRAIFKPYVEKVSSNYLLIGGLGSGLPGSGRENEKLKDEYYKSIDDSLDYMFETASTKKWIAKKHNYIKANLSVFIEAPKTAEGIYKILKMIEELNNKLRSFHLYSYDFRVITYKLPQNFNISVYFDKVAPDFTITGEWLVVEGIQKYAWGYLRIKSCPEIKEFEKACYQFRNRRTGELELELIKYYTGADKIHNINNIINNFRLVTKFGVPSKCNDSAECFVKWGVNLRANTLLKDSKYYLKLEQLIKKGNK